VRILAVLYVILTQNGATQMLPMKISAHPAKHKLWKTGHKIDFLRNLHCFFMSLLVNFR